MPAALQYAQEAYRLTGGRDPHVNDTLGYLYLQQGLVDRSISLLEKAREDDPELDDAAFHLAMAYRQAERPEDARLPVHDDRSDGLDAWFGPGLDPMCSLHHSREDLRKGCLVDVCVRSALLTDARVRVVPTEPSGEGPIAALLRW